MLMRSFFWIFFCSTTFSKLVRGFTVSSKVVQCYSDSIDITIEFEEEFNGVVFAKNHFTNLNCKAVGNGENSVSISIPLTIDSTQEPFCGVAVKDSLTYSVDIVVSGLQNLLIAGIHEYEVQCQYSQASVTITAAPGITGALRVLLPEESGELITGASSAKDLPTQLELKIREDHGYTGGIVQQAYVGQEITLDVSFEDGGDSYDMFIYNCYAHDALGEGGANITLIDENGCAISLEQITNPPLQIAIDEENKKHIYLPLYGFRFTTSEFVFFECQVKPCFTDCSSISVRFSANACTVNSTIVQAQSMILHHPLHENASFARTDNTTIICNGTVCTSTGPALCNGTNASCNGSISVDGAITDSDVNAVEKNVDGSNTIVDTPRRRVKPVAKGKSGRTLSSAIREPGINLSTAASYLIIPVIAVLVAALLLFVVCRILTL